MNDFANIDFDEFKIEEIKNNLAGYISEGRLDQKVVDLLIAGNSCIPLECELLDYKQELGTDKIAQAKAIVSIVSMYNTYGGYLVYGVAETQSETEFMIVGVEKNSIDLERLKALTKEYTGERIQLALQYFNLSSANLDGNLKHVAVLYIPKRVLNEPLAFGKRGPEDTNRKNKPVFEEEDIFYRKGDECLLAKGRAVLSLAGPRQCPYDDSRSPIDALIHHTSVVDHNLPDRNFICERFIGRREQIDDLWSWFADEFSHVRVLAGEGGLGKTSIAYRFAEELCKGVGSGIERIIWLTAKKYQFSGIENRHLEVPSTHFDSFITLLRELCSELGFIPSEIEDASERLLRKNIQEGAKITPTLIVVDDVDSLEVEDQRKVLEIGFLFGGTRSRLLLTTRVNLSYSSDIAIQIPGFDFDDDYQSYIDSLQERYPYVKLTAQQRKAIHEATGGSPMFTDSIYRIMRNATPADSINQWRGHMGEDARAAALKTEIEQLSSEAKRALLSAAYLTECSYAELSQITGYSDTVLGDCIAELRSLYLLSAPQVTSEPRFKVKANTRNYVLRSCDILVTDYKRVEARVKELRNHGGGFKAKQNTPLVGAAINQAIAQIKQNDIQSALETINAAEKEYSNHPDVLTMKARCLLKLSPPQVDEARRLARNAFNAGSRKEILFEVWYEAEWLAKHYNGAIEPAQYLIESGANNKSEWLIRRAAAQWHIAQDQERAGNWDRAVSDYWICANDLSKAQTEAALDEINDLRRQKVLVHDAIWNVFYHMRDKSVDSITRAIDELRKILRSGDTRFAVYHRLIEALSWLSDAITSRKGKPSEGARNLLEQRLREVRSEIDDYALCHRAEDRVQKLYLKWDAIANVQI